MAGRSGRDPLIVGNPDEVFEKDEHILGARLR